jgi:hypothetical protein
LCSHAFGPIIGAENGTGEGRLNAARLFVRGSGRPLRRSILRAVAVAALVLVSRPATAQTLNAYSIWPENWARPMLQEFEAATGIK